MEEKEHNALFYDLKALNSLEYLGLQIKISNLQNSQIEKVGKKAIDIRKQAAITIQNELKKFVANTKKLKNSLNDEN